MSRGAVKVLRGVLGASFIVLFFAFNYFRRSPADAPWWLFVVLGVAFSVALWLEIGEQRRERSGRTR